MEESEADRKEREAARLEIGPVKPGDDPPTYGDEGGGNLFPEQEPKKPSLLRRLGSLLRGLRGPSSLRRPA